MDDSLATRYC